MQYVPLTEGVSIPIIGIGTWQLEKEQCRNTVRSALEIGYRHIDTADHYGNHADVATAIKESGVPRSQIHITSKLWRTDLAADDVPEAVTRALHELDTSYIDLYLIHFPDSSTPIAETLRALDAERSRGRIGAIGVSNCVTGHIRDALASGVEVVNNQIEYHPSFQQDNLVSYCRTNGISVTAYSPIGQGTELELQEVRDIAARYKVSPAQVILAWEIKKGLIVIPRACSAEHQRENLKAADVTLRDEDTAALDSLECGNRLNAPEYNEFDKI